MPILRPASRNFRFAGHTGLTTNPFRKADLPLHFSSSGARGSSSANLRLQDLRWSEGERQHGDVVLLTEALCRAGDLFRRVS